MKHAWITQHRDSFPVALMCDVLDVSKSGYYAALERPESPRAIRGQRIRATVRQIHAASHGIYGSGKIAQELAQSDSLETACRNTVARAMRELGLKSRVTKAFTPTTTKSDPTKQPAPNTLDRDFSATAPNQKWVTDITYLPTSQGWVYLAVVLDLFSRKVVGWAIGDSLATPLVAAALRRAIESVVSVKMRTLVWAGPLLGSWGAARETLSRSRAAACVSSRFLVPFDSPFVARDRNRRFPRGPRPAAPCRGTSACPTSCRPRALAGPPRASAHCDRRGRPRPREFAGGSPA